MPLRFRRSLRLAVLSLLLAAITCFSIRTHADTGACNGTNITLPFTDVAASFFFCQIANAYFAGLTNGTTATTYTPGAPVTREQMAAFTTRTLNQSLRRSSRRAALRQWSDPQTEDDLATINVSSSPQDVEADGTSLWVAGFNDGMVRRIDAATGEVLGTWTGATKAVDILIAKWKVFVLGADGALFQINPTQPPGAVSTVTTGLGTACTQLAFDGSNIWGTAFNEGRIFKVALDPVSVMFISDDFASPLGIFFDGKSLWITDSGDETLKNLIISPRSVTTIPLPGAINPGLPAFDGINLWVPSRSNQMFVVRINDSVGNSVTPTVIATLAGNGLVAPFEAAFDGERILVVNNLLAPSAGVSLWRASDLAPLGSIATSATPRRVCSDGINFWFTLHTGNLARF